ncbi:hypothetical protein [uncultured Thiodictyon sp.]|nr:hypothetical protein [uncultured Thiodictyon sp.]
MMRQAGVRAKGDGRSRATAAAVARLCQALCAASADVTPTGTMRQNGD